ncbi:hypothetical protein CAPTEDRAFT_213487 [Capitella teleta]|uniref:G-protein coupled receptors family 1 profile domain-containing protein n=1 Tax=Capitella teleta TaxID=283909 RepID=R7TSK8_CAPTE|nr:hypothetical protein CAPTEDRAFT_213487 [Capitella teleta]|eukprot:ELT94471.1 hypothetical protein CAPTEDRAFT_213487 [Capitella teleta]
METHTVETFSSAAAEVAPRSAIFRPWFTALMVTGLLMSAAGVPGNLLTIVAYLKHAQLRNPTNLLICSQTIGDLLTCLTGPIFFVLNYSEAGLVLASSYKYLCLIGLGTLMLSLQSSILNILALSTERFIAVFSPYDYYSWITETKVKIAVAVIWSSVLVINFLPFFGWDTWSADGYCMATRVYSPIFSQFIYLLPCAICLLISAVQNILIGGMAAKKQRSVVPVAAQGNQESADDGAARKSQFKVTKMLLQVVGVFYISWMPQIITNVLLINPPKSWRQNGIPEWYYFMNEWAKPAMMINTIANPFIYAFKNVHYRTAYFKILGIKNNEVEP